ncbi:MAG: hypothetical protein R2745_24870 [Vicinamibacterales bacterium]
MPSGEPIVHQHGLIVFAKDTQKVSAFYAAALGLDRVESGPGHDLLAGPGCEIVVHAIPPQYAADIAISTPPEPRSETALKPAFVVGSLESVRAAIEATGGGLKPAESAWTMRGFDVLDGWDPEGNIIQFRQPSAA